jgi:hypothetical protein
MTAGCVALDGVTGRKCALLGHDVTLLSEELSSARSWQMKYLEASRTICCEFAMQDRTSGSYSNKTRLLSITPCNSAHLGNPDTDQGLACNGLIRGN